MSAAQALARMLRDMQADQLGYTRLLELLEAQFEAALRHQAEALTRLAGEIGALVDQLDTRRQQRGLLLAQLLNKSPAPSITELLQRLPSVPAQTLTVAWQGLEQQVRECKRLNLRNCHLITEQHALMQRVLGVEEAGYAER